MSVYIPVAALKDFATQAKKVKQSADFLAGAEYGYRYLGSRIFNIAVEPAANQTKAQDIVRKQVVTDQKLPSVEWLGERYQRLTDDIAKQLMDKDKCIVVLFEDLKTARDYIKQLESELLAKRKK